MQEIRRKGLGGRQLRPSHPRYLIARLIRMVGVRHTQKDSLLGADIGLNIDYEHQPQRILALSSLPVLVDVLLCETISGCGAELKADH